MYQNFICIAQDIVSIVRDIFQILFFVIVGLVTLLTYLKAKRTLFQPIKTEVFKEQIKVFSDILSFFRGKKEIDLSNEFNFDKLLEVNCISLIDDYASFHFDMKFDINERPYNASLCPVSIMSVNSLILMENYHENDFNEFIETKQSRWNEYVYDEIKVLK